MFDPDVNNYSGIWVVDKPYGLTSADVLRKLKRLLGPIKIGHTGTLDPLATGVLPVCMGEATKLISYMILEPKTYQGRLKLGHETDSWDITGKVVFEQEVPPLTRESLQPIFSGFLGRQLLEPPQFSAIKYKGRPLYTYARKGIPVAVSPREMFVSHFELLAVDGPYLDFELVCSRGTYVRSITHLLGKAVGCGACLISLRRFRCGQFGIEDALSIEQIDEIIKKGDILEASFAPVQVLDHMDKYRVKEVSEKKVKHGNPLWNNDLEGVCNFMGKTGEKVRLTVQGRLAAIAEIRKNNNGLFLQPVRVFHTTH